MAAHLEGKGAGVIDMAGLAQKGGAVYSHIRIANTPDDIHAIRVAAGGADLVLGGDSVVVGNKKVLGAIKAGHTRVVVNTAEFLPGDFTRNADYSLPTERLKRAITAAAGPGQSHFVDASRLATALLGNSIGGNMFMLGYAYQTGALPLSAEAIERAIEMNGEAVAMNIAAFRYGRRAAVDPAALEALVKPAPELVNDSLKLSQSFAETVERRVAFLTAYQNARYARRYRDWVEKVRTAEAEQGAGPMRAVGSGGALSVQADGLQGRIRGGAALHRHVIRRAGEIDLRRRQSALRIPSGAAAVGAPRQGHRRAEEDVVRALVARRVARAGEIQGAARHAARSVRLYRRAKNRAAVDLRVLRSSGRHRRTSDAGQSSSRQ